MYAPFDPANTVILACTGSSASVALPSGGNQVELSNDGAVAIFVRFGTSAVTSTVPNGTTGGYYVGPGQSKVVSRNPQSETHVAGITGGTAATLYISVGDGQ